MMTDDESGFIPCNGVGEELLFSVFSVFVVGRLNVPRKLNFLWK